MASKIVKGDTVQVIAGEYRRSAAERDKARGIVQRIDTKTGRVVVAKINMVKKHQKPMQGRAARTQVGIIEFEAPIDLSNVMLVCPKCDEAVRVGFRVDGDEKVRVCKSCGEDIK
ncbi:50S ribosomal protein L24 [Thermoflexales bacterium]|nr:50S ribosomal protein L24 [Thermoflexales bacterium]